MLWYRIDGENWSVYITDDYGNSVAVKNERKVLAFQNPLFWKYVY